MTYNHIFSVKFIRLCLLVFLIAFGLSSLVSNQDNSELQLANSPNQRISNTEIALIYFGCSTCPAALDERLPGIIQNLSEKLRNSAVNKNYEFTIIGTSNELQIDQGIKYLQSIASFDELSLGNSMRNSTLQNYVWDKYDDPLSASTPQVIISKRIYDTMAIGNRDEIHPRIISEEVLTRQIGTDRIGQLVYRDDFYQSL